MLFIAAVMGLLCGTLVDYTLGRFAVKDPRRIVAASIVAVVVFVFVWVGKLAHF